MKAAKLPRNVDPSKYLTRQIALKLAYLGQGYNGLEYHKHNDTPLPTVEETLWHALKKTQLIFPATDPTAVEDAISWEGCEYSKCGRTDRGVSAFGQVVALRVRSNRPVSQAPEAAAADEQPSQAYSDEDLDVRMIGKGNDTDNALNEKFPFDDIKDELPYIKILNRVLPDDIRILAWCPAPAGFSARFSCRERRYRYFFTQPAFMTSSPTTTATLSGAANNKAPYIESSNPAVGHLNIPAMQAAAAKFIGLHDFRNFCKIDASKQLENFERRIFRSEIVPITTSPPLVAMPDHNLDHHPSSTPPPQPPPMSHIQTFAFILHGSAFLWHQVRHMVAILFLIGQGLESPSLIDDLFDIRKTPAKPRYEMADDAPLVLWDCIFPKLDTKREGLEEIIDEGGKGDHMPQAEQQGGYEDALPWITEHNQAISQNPSSQAGSSRKELKPPKSDLSSTLWRLYRKSKIDCILSEQLLTSALTFSRSTSSVSHASASGTQIPTHEHYNSDDQEAAAAAAAVASSTNTHDIREGVSSTSTSTRIFLGGNEARLAGRYVPVMERPSGEGVEGVNRRWREKMEMKGLKGRIGRGEEGEEEGQEEIAVEEEVE